MCSSSPAYFNNATTSFPKSDFSLNAYLSAIRRTPQDIRHSAVEHTDIEVARNTVAGVVGCDKDETFFTADATTGINQILQGYLRPGDYCIVDNRTHNAVTRTLQGIGYVSWDVIPLMNRDDEIQIDEVDRRPVRKPALFCISHASNVTGSLYDIVKVISVVRSLSPTSAILIDASQAAGHVDLAALGKADFAIFPSHKYLHAPAGAAVIVARRQLQQTLFGGTGTRSAELRTGEVGKNLTEVGTPNGPAISALAAALIVDKSQRAENARKLANLTQRLWDGLSSIEGLQLFGRPPNAARTSIVSFATKNISPECEWMPYLQSRGIIARGGLHCCPLFHEQFGLLTTGTVRFSPSIYSTIEEVDYVVRAVDEFVRALR
jgi:cysteine desulfurase / selenocysteine lyase